ncbi:SMP-30/gluconolactonase/LRE family protein [Kribbella sp. CA-247076]|uniref:SMP-30/gluconolactonase/LRE family protein n=1 Tax=Kribbella sp. CA-247076 TaxID=3239941 RepID=UPI003D91C857
MKKLICALVILGAVTVSAGQAGADPGPRPTTYIVSRDQGVLPESISVSRDGTMYVSSFGTGAIYRGNTRNPMMHVFKPAGADGRIKASGVEVDRRGRIWVAGWDTDTIWVYNPDGSLLAKRTVPDTGSALNDLIVTDEAVYVTDSFTGSLWRAPVRGSQIGELSRWLSSEDFPAQPGFLNGIVGTPGGRIALIADSVEGSGLPGDARLFRVDLRTRAVTEVAVSGGFLVTMDGLLLEGRRLYADVNFPDGQGNTNYAVDLAVLNADLTALRLVHRSGTAPRTQAPTAVARDGRRLLWVNSQFGGNPPAPPFTVTEVPGIR